MVPTAPRRKENQPTIGIIMRKRTNRLMLPALINKKKINESKAIVIKKLRMVREMKFIIKSI